MPKAAPDKPPIRFSGKRLLEWRRVNNMSRSRLARAIDFIVGEHQIIRYEKGQCVPDYDTAQAIARALNISLEDLSDAPR